MPGTDNKSVDNDIFTRLYHLRSDIPAITHIDFSARIQTVYMSIKEKYWQRNKRFKEKPVTGFWPIRASMSVVNQ